MICASYLQSHNEAEDLGLECKATVSNKGGSCFEVCSEALTTRSLKQPATCHAAAAVVERIIITHEWAELMKHSLG